MTSLSKAVQAWLILVAGFAVALNALDRVPAFLSGSPHGARVYATVARAEAAIGAQIWVPPSWPDSLVGPPVRVDVWPGRPMSVALHVAERPPGREDLVRRPKHSCRLRRR
jgi:hypothetical protein